MVTDSVSTGVAITSHATIPAHGMPALVRMVAWHTMIFRAGGGVDRLIRRLGVTDEVIFMGEIAVMALGMYQTLMIVHILRL